MSQTLNLRVYHGEEFVRELTLTQDVIKIGRLRACHLHLEDESVGRMHAVIENMDELRVVDLGASAGTTLNGQRVPRNAVLGDGDILQFGPFRVVVYVAADAPQSAADPPGKDEGPDIAKLLRRLSALFKISVDQDGTPEGENAARMMATLRDSHGLDVFAHDLEDVEIWCDNDHDWERDLARLISNGTHTQVDVLDGKLRFRGLRVAVEEAVAHYEAHRKTCRRLVAFTAVGYMIGTFGAEAFNTYRREAKELSATIQEAQQADDDDDDLFSREPSDAENGLIVAAGRVGKTEPITFWGKLKARVGA